MHNSLPKQLDTEVNLLGRINVNLKSYRVHMSLVREMMFSNPTCKIVYMFFSKTKHDITSYPYEILEYNLREKPEIDLGILKSITNVTNSVKTITNDEEVATWTFFLATHYTLGHAKQIGTVLQSVRTIGEVEQSITALTKLISFNKTEAKNDWEAMQKQSDKLAKPFPTNFEAFEKAIGGYYSTDINFIHGPSSHGKSSLFLYEISESIKKNKDLTGKIFLSEMSAVRFWMRILSKDLKQNLPDLYRMTEENWEMLKETYGNRLVIRDGYNAEEITAEIIRDRRSINGIDSLQFILRDAASPTPAAIQAELNMFQAAINNAGSPLLIISHINRNKYNEFIKDVPKDVNNLYAKGIPPDELMEWSGACQKLGRRNFGILAPGIITENPHDARRFFVKLNKNTHGERGQKFSLWFDQSTYNFYERTK